ncbi:uncharacterized protein LOC134699224 [Mytilus trossulus]|uniref:uncharacterized protein LOC134699224 n=1 Tax=Mytilus trossulus TaxID=6551 RepID=UPI0030069B4A
MSGARYKPGSRKFPRRRESPAPSEGSVGSEGGVISRQTYQAPEGYDTPIIRQFREYLDNTGLEQNFKDLIKLLLDRNELPYNPYPGFVNRFRQFGEKFHMEQESAEKIHHKLRNAMKETFLPYLFTVKNHNTVWGLSSILKVINPQALSKYKWLLDDLTPHPEDVLSSGDYTNQVMLALVGSCVFDGTFFPQVHSVTIRKEYLVSGEDVQQGVSIFVNSIMAEIDSMYSNPRHIMLGINIPYANEEYPDVVMFEFWDPDRIQGDKDEFLQIVSDTVVNNKYIHMECVLRISPYHPQYMRGTIQFSLNFLEIKDDLIEEGLQSFAEYPMASLHEGVFLNATHAEAYLSIFSPTVDQYDDQTPRSPLPQSRQAKGRAPTSHAPSRAHSRAHSRVSQITGHSRNRKFSSAQGQDLTRIKQHVYDRMDHIKPQKVRIDGFRIGDESSYGPFAWQITTPIKAYLQKKMASHQMHAELFEAVLCGILLWLLDRESFNKDLTVELYKLTHSTAGSLYLIMEQNKTLRYILKAFVNRQETGPMREYLALYRESFVHLFLSSLYERSNEQITVGKVAVAQLDDLMPNSMIQFGSYDHVQMALKTLKNMNWYCMSLLLQLSEDSLNRCPIFKDILITMKSTFPDVIPQPITRHRNRQDPAGVDLETDVVHGLEDENIINHERLVINIDECEAKDSAPKTISRESVFIKYMIDTHLDESWHKYLTELVTAEFFPPNPFPRLTTIFRQNAMRMDLCFERDSVITENILNTNIKLDDKENFIFNIPGIDAYGTPSALQVLDTGIYMNLSQIVSMLTQQNYIQRKGPYRVGICLALSGPSILYGKMQPYLNEVELHEHCYIMGPPGCQGEAVQLFAMIVQNYLVDLIQKNMIPVSGIYFGESQNRWTWEDILTLRAGFISEFCTICNRKGPIFMKAFVLMDQWRYVPVRKYFLLHFMTDDEIEGELFFPDNPVAFYQSIFLSRDRAAFHYQNGGPKQGVNPMTGPNVKNSVNHLDYMMAAAKSRSDWITVHRALLLKSLIQQNDTHIGESWRMLHSVAAQVEYIIALIDAIQDLVQLIIEYKEFLTKYESSPKTAASQRTRATPPQSRAQTGQKTADSHKARKANTLLPNFQSPIDEGVFGQMCMVFHRRLVEICKGRITLASTALSEFVKAKLKTSIEEDPYLNNFYFAYEDQTLFRLEEVKHMMRMVQDCLSSDVHLISDKAQSVVDNLETNMDEGRPSSVASYILNDPYMKIKHPRAQMTAILE